MLIKIIRSVDHSDFAPVPFSSLVCPTCHSIDCRCFDVDIPFVENPCRDPLYFPDSKENDNG